MTNPGIKAARDLLSKDRSRRSNFSVHPSSCRCDDCMIRRHLEIALDCLEVMFNWDLNWGDEMKARDNYEEAASERS